MSFQDPEQVLKRNLSTKSAILTTSSFAQRMQEAARKIGIERIMLRNIGLGSCGSVFQVPGTQFAYKKGTKEPDILRDFRLTNKFNQAVRDVREALGRAFSDLKVPRTPKCHDYHASDDKEFWDKNLERFPEDHRTRQPVFSVDRILPMPKDAREALIEIFFEEDEDIQQKAREDPDNKDCLIRLYLGERESARHQTEDYHSLRNFPLRLNTMEDFELDINILADEMALGLAAMHWQGQIDAMDVEFVLGSSATWDGKSSLTTDFDGNINPQLRQIEMWILDFDKASEFELSEHDVKNKLVPAFLGNDPYYPRPDVDPELWKVFCTTYLKASEIILGNRGVNSVTKCLPAYFVEEVSKKVKENEDWSEEHNIVFSE